MRAQNARCRSVSSGQHVVASWRDFSTATRLRDRRRAQRLPRERKESRGGRIGGMPVALRRPPGRSRSRWFANYVDLAVDKDVMGISRVQQREMLPRLLGQLAAPSGQVLNITSVAATRSGPGSCRLANSGRNP